MDHTEAEAGFINAIYALISLVEKWGLSKPEIAAALDTIVRELVNQE